MKYHISKMAIITLRGKKNHQNATQRVPIAANKRIKNFGIKYLLFGVRFKNLRGCKPVHLFHLKQNKKRRE